jgi:hypothetical protein
MINKLVIIFVLLGLSTYSIGLSSPIKLVKVAKLPTIMYETSGLIFYQNKYIITHNDGGNKSEIYLLNLKGELVKTIDVDEVNNKDWEDIATDKAGRLYIGDFGNNLNKRKKCMIYILKKNFSTDENLRVNPKKIEFAYEDQKKFPPKKEKQNFDAEALIWMKDSLYIFTKCRSKPFTGISKIYSLPDKEGKYEAKLIGQIQFCKSNWQWCSVTAADYNPETKSLVVLTYSRLYVISNFDGNKFWTGKMKSYNLPSLKQREGICYKGPNSWYMSDEYRKGLGGGNLYTLDLK